MAFSQSGITAINVRTDGPDLFVTWESSAPTGTIYQVYTDHRLSWFGPSLRCHVPAPSRATGRNTWVDVGSVGPGEDTLDFSSSLASLSQGIGMVQLAWAGGTYLDRLSECDVQGFRVYQSPLPNTPADLTTPVDEIAAYPGGWISDGFGLGGFGLGGFGRSANSYAWTPGFLPSGVWEFGVIPYDTAGNNRGSGQTSSVTVAVPPRPPALPPGGNRLNSSYSDPATRQVTLTWLASPSA